MKIIQARESLENIQGPTVFIAGPTSRSPIVPSWRPEAIRLFQELEFQGTILSPEDKKGFCQNLNYSEQIEWEEQALKLADCIMFWIPRSFPDMPAFTTNVEYGVWQSSGKVVLGAPLMAQKVGYLFYYAKKLDIPNFRDLKETVLSSIQRCTK